MSVSAEALLRQRGLRVTPQRQAVLRIFLDQEGFHATADQIRSRLLPHMPGLARGTTYKVLEELVKAQICEELATEQGVSLYGLRLSPHHHFVCDGCHRWHDVDVTGLDALVFRGMAPGTAVRDVAVVFRGLCPACQS